MDKKTWLDILYYDIGRQQFDFKLASLWIDNEGISKSSKWIEYSKLVMPLDIDEGWKINSINNRQIFPNELIIDLEDFSHFKEVIHRLDKLVSSYYIFTTHSRGVHIHIFRKEPFKLNDKIFFLTQYFGDLMKAYDKSTIALEYATHWKSGKIKERIDKNGNRL